MQKMYQVKDGKLVKMRSIAEQEEWFLEDMLERIIWDDVPETMEGPRFSGIPKITDGQTGVEIAFLDHEGDKVFMRANEVFLRLRDRQFGWTRQSWGRAFDYRPGELAIYREGEAEPIIICSLAEETTKGQFGWLVDSERSRAISSKEAIGVFCEIVGKCRGNLTMTVEKYPVLAE